MEELDLVVSIPKSTFAKNAWDGLSLKESIQGTVDELIFKKNGQTRSILPSFEAIDLCETKADHSCDFNMPVHGGAHRQRSDAKRIVMLKKTLS